MSNSNIFTVIGIMSGTSMDGVDFSLVQTDGINYTKIINEREFKYSRKYKNKLIKLINNLPSGKKNQLVYIKKNEKFITENFLKYIKKFLKIIESKKYNVELIGLSGQTIFHNPEKKYSLQLGSGKEIYKNIKIPVISNFRKKDLLNGGQGAPIGSFYHKSILDKINKKACIVNLGGISNITFSNKSNLISYDMGPANALIDDLCNFYYNKNYDKFGYYASKGNLIKKILKKFKKNNFFKKKYPKSLDRYYFNSFFEELQNQNANDAINTATIMTIQSVIIGIKLLKYKIDTIILCGGGRKNLFIVENLQKQLKSIKIKVETIDKYGLNGDLVEAQMFGYLAVRSIKKLPLSTPTTTGVISSQTGGYQYGKLIKY